MGNCMIIRKNGSSIPKNITLLASGIMTGTGKTTVCTTTQKWNVLIAVVANSDNNGSTTANTVSCDGGTELLNVGAFNYDGTSGKAKAYVTLAIYTNVPSGAKITTSGGSWSKVYKVYAY